MNKWIAIVIPIISLLAVGVMVTGVVYLHGTNKLNDAQDEIVALEGNVSTLESNVLALEAEVSTLEGDLAAAEAEVSTLEAKVLALESDVLALGAGLAPITFPDTNLEAAVRGAINKPEGPIYTSDLELRNILNKKRAPAATT